MVSDHSRSTPAAGAERRGIPAVGDVVGRLEASGRVDSLPRPIVVQVTRAVLDEYRSSLTAAGGPVDVLSGEDLADQVALRLKQEGRSLLLPVINATGIIIHTGLGRAPLADAAVSALRDVAGAYAPLEFDTSTGGRGRRGELVRGPLCRLTGAESAMVVNNNAAALLLVLWTLAKGSTVIVSRGELIEIGGSFRLPEIMEASGAILREVGTTNRTRLDDYERAIDDTTALLLKVHTSNYRIEGFTHEVSIGELADLGRRRGVKVIHDIGSGAMAGLDRAGLGGEEPTASASIEAGADLVMFSGDKLLGGPQAGIIVGRTALIDEIQKQPLMRAVRVGKLTLAALAATLELHMDPAQAAKSIPVLAMAAAPIEALERRGRELIMRMGALDGVGDVDLVESTAYLGGGTLPARAVASRAVAVRSASMSEVELARRLRTGTPSVIPRTRDAAVWLDLRTVFESQDDDLVEAVRCALTAHPGTGESA